MTLYLVRHASAGIRGSLSDDTARPLDDHGRAQALAIARLLRHAPVDLVASSRAVRCVETVEPLAVERNLEVERHPSLFEGAAPHHTLALVEELAADGRHAVLCSHGDVIPDVLQLLVNRGLELGAERGFAKGSVWTIDSDGTELTRAHYVSTKATT